MTSVRYRPEIDGLRAVAVIPVILFHFNSNWLPGGYIGVDIFFVISGFLITSILLDEHERGAFSFSNFWLRRIKRILPALTIMVLATLILGFIISYSSDISYLGNQGLASLLSFANISHWLMAGNYWGNVAENSPLLHTWSLSVEEQFYLIFPFLLFISLKFFKSRLTLIFITLSLLSFLLFIYGTQFHPVAAFYLLPTRAWELGIGAVTASLLFSRHVQIKYHALLSSAGVFIIILSYLFISGEGELSPLLIAPVLAAALLIIATTNTNNIISKALSTLPTVYIGKISYSLYLWHWPILVFSKQLTLSQAVSANPIAIFLLIFSVSVLSYHLVEVPARNKEKTLRYILVVFFIGIAFSYVLKVGDYREDTSLYNATHWDGELYNVNPDKQWSESEKQRMAGISVAHDDSINLKAYSLDGIKKLYGGATPDIVVLGDSHALMWSKVLDEIAEELSISISFFGSDGTSPFFEIPPVQTAMGSRFLSATEKYHFDKARLRSLSVWKPRVVIITSRWGRQDVIISDDLIDHIATLGSTIILIEQAPPLYFGDKNAPLYLSYLGLMPKDGSKQYIRHVNRTPYLRGVELVKQLAKENDHCLRVPISDIFLDEGRVWVIDNNNVLYIDDDHLSYAGALKGKNRLAAAIREIIQ